MLDTVRLYVDAALAIAIMATIGVIAGFAAAAITGDRATVIAATGVAFVLTGAILIFRLWRLTRKPAHPIDPGV